MTRAGWIAVVAVLACGGGGRDESPPSPSRSTSPRRADGEPPPTPPLALKLQQADPAATAAVSPPVPARIGPSSAAAEALAGGIAARRAGDAARARQELSRGCDAGHPRACAQAAELEPDASRAEALRQRAKLLDAQLCADGWAPGCDSQVIMLLVDRQVSGSAAPGSALNGTLSLFRRAAMLYGEECAKGERASCWGLFHMVDTVIQRAEAADAAGAELFAANKPLDLVAAGCKAKIIEACTRAATLHQTGEYGVPRDPVGAFGWWRKACEVGDDRSCVEIARRYEKGDGVGRDLDRAEHWHKVACMRGQAVSCPDSCRLSKKRGAADPDTCQN